MKASDHNAFIRLDGKPERILEARRQTAPDVFDGNGVALWIADPTQEFVAQPFGLLFVPRCCPAHFSIGCLGKPDRLQRGAECLSLSSRRISVIASRAINRIELVLLIGRHPLADNCPFFLGDFRLSARTGRDAAHKPILSFG